MPALLVALAATFLFKHDLGLFFPVARNVLCAIIVLIIAVRAPGFIWNMIVPRKIL